MCSDFIVEKTLKLREKHQNKQGLTNALNYAIICSSVASKILLDTLKNRISSSV